MDGPTLILARCAISILSQKGDLLFRATSPHRDIHFSSKPFSLKQLAVKVKDVISGDLAKPEFPDCVREQNEYTSGLASRCTQAPAVK